ncbi:hypothetical protein T484DRAFT_1803541, partial [Baffinella frigidus]
MGGMGGGGMGGMPPGMDFGKLMSDPSIMAAMQNPKMMQLMSDLSIMAAIQNPKMMQIFAEVQSNPAAMMKYQNDPE